MHNLIYLFAFHWSVAFAHTARALVLQALCAYVSAVCLCMCVPCSVHERFCFCFLGPTLVFNFCLLFLFKNIALTAFAPTARALLCCRQRARRLCMRVCPAAYTLEARR